MVKHYKICALIHESQHVQQSISLDAIHRKAAAGKEQIFRVKIMLPVFSCCRAANTTESIKKKKTRENRKTLYTITIYTTLPTDITQENE